MSDTLCDFSSDLICRQCGYVASTPMLRRHCRPQVTHGERRVLHVPPPTLEDLYAVQSAARGDGSTICLAGTALSSILSRLGITYTPDCPCRSHVAMMDAWGCDECERRIDEIVGWLREEAGKRGLPFLDAVGRMVVRRAIKNARKAGLTRNRRLPHT
jgi:predicted Fe-S protein YdhL (DUF1289 family)